MLQELGAGSVGLRTVWVVHASGFEVWGFRFIDWAVRTFSAYCGGYTLIKPNYLKECYRHVHRGREREGIAAIIKSSMGGWDAGGGIPKQESVYL